MELSEKVISDTMILFKKNELIRHLKFQNNNYSLYVLKILNHYSLITQYVKKTSSVLFYKFITKLLFILCCKIHLPSKHFNAKYEFNIFKFRLVSP